MSGTKPCKKKKKKKKKKMVINKKIMNFRKNISVIMIILSDFPDPDKIKKIRKS